MSSSPIIGTTRTRTDQIPSIGNSFYVSPNGDATGCVDGATFASIQSAVDCAQPGDTVYVKSGTYPGGIIVSNSGTANNYITVTNYQSDEAVIDANDESISCAGAWSMACAFHITGSYVRLSGFDITGGWNLYGDNGYGIIVGPEKGTSAQQPHDVIVEDNIIRDPKTFTSSPGRFIAVRIGGKSSGFYTEVENITVQSNTMYMVEPGGGAKGQTTGASIVLTWPNGGHVIRNNNINFRGTTTVHGTDCIVTVPNFPDNTEDLLRSTKDTDMYNNWCEGATDDGISLDGSGTNVRVWNNTILRSMVGLSVAPIVIGPTYIFRNVFTEPENHWANACSWIKGGEGSTGNVYFYHNTVVYDNLVAEGDGLDCPHTRGFGLAQGSGSASTNVYSLNNIIELDGTVTSTKTKVPTMDYDLSYNPMANGAKFRWADWGGESIGHISLTNSQNFAEFQSTTCSLGDCQETNGMAGQATFVSRATENFHLVEGSLGIDQGTLIQGFNDTDSAWPFKGTSPDIGAYEYSSLPDTTAPVISDIGVTPDFTSAQVTWLTDDSSDALVEYGLSSTSLSQSVSLGLLRKSHSLNIPGLDSDEAYFYKVTSCNSDGLCSASAIGSFTTLFRQPDTTAPVISSISVTPDFTSAQVTWLTDDSSDALVEYGLSSTSLSLSMSSAPLSISHSLDISGLSSDETYYYKITSCNSDGLCSSSSVDSFTTLARQLASLPLRINTGGSQATDTSNNIWYADQLYVPTGSWGYTDPHDNSGSIDRKIKDPTLDISNTDDEDIFTTERWKMDSYTVNVPNGVYDVKLKFAETYSGISGQGQRVFDVFVEGSKVLDRLDIYSEVGFASALIKDIQDVLVSDGQLNIDFTGVADSPMINGIEVMADSISSSPTVTLTAPSGQIATGESVSLPILLDSGPNGIAGYVLDVILSDPSIARITGVDFPSFGLAELVTFSPSHVQLRVVDTNLLIQNEVTGFPIANLIIEGILDGTSLVNIPTTSIEMDDDTGNPLVAQVQAGNITVVSYCPKLPNMTSFARDTDLDGLCEDINGNERLDFADVVTLFVNIGEPVIRDNAERFDFNGNTFADMQDVIELFRILLE